MPPPRVPRLRSSLAQREQSLDEQLVTHADGEVAADFRLRLDRVQAAMRERGLGGLVLYSSGQHNMLRMDEVHYLSDFRGIGVHTVLLMPPSGEPTLLLTPPWEAHRAREAVWFESVEAVDPAELDRAGSAARGAAAWPRRAQRAAHHAARLRSRTGGSAWSAVRGCTGPGPGLARSADTG